MDGVCIAWGSLYLPHANSFLSSCHRILANRRMVPPVNASKTTYIRRITDDIPSSNDRQQPPHARITLNDLRTRPKQTIVASAVLCGAVLQHAFVRTVAFSGPKQDHLLHAP